MGQAGAQHSQSPIKAEGGAVMMIFRTGSIRKSMQKCNLGHACRAPGFLAVPLPDTLLCAPKDPENDGGAHKKKGRARPKGQVSKKTYRLMIRSCFTVITSRPLTTGLAASVSGSAVCSTARMATSTA